MTPLFLLVLLNSTASAPRNPASVPAHALIVAPESVASTSWVADSSLRYTLPAPTHDVPKPPDESPNAAKPWLDWIGLAAQVTMAICAIRALRSITLASKTLAAANLASLAATLDGLAEKPGAHRRTMIEAFAPIWDQQLREARQAEVLDDADEARLRAVFARPTSSNPTAQP